MVGYSTNVMPRTVYCLLNSVETDRFAFFFRCTRTNNDGSDLINVKSTGARYHFFVRYFGFILLVCFNVGFAVEFSRFEPLFIYSIFVKMR